MFEAKEIIGNNNDWVTAVLLFIFFGLTLVRMLYKERLYHESTFFISKKYLSIYFNKEKGKLLNVYQTVLFIVQILVISLLIYLGVKLFNIRPISNELSNFIVVFLAVGFYFVIHYLLSFLLSYLFNFTNEYVKIAYTKTSYFNNLILWILPFLVFGVYGNEHAKLFQEITFLILTFLLTLRYGLILLNNKKFIFNNLFYFILYLCALEIAPLIIVLKLTI
jgi:hypothetical protein